MVEKNKSPITNIYIIVPLIILFFIVGIYLYSKFLGGYAIYENKDYGFSMKYPSGYSIVEGEGGTIVAFVSPKETEMDQFLENVNIVYQDMSADPLTLKQFADRAVSQLSATFQDMNIIENIPVNVNGLSAYRIIYAAKENSPLKIMTVVIMAGENSFYSIFFTAQSQQFDDNLLAVMGMVNSFRLTK